MGLEKLISAVSVLAILAVSTGQLPPKINFVHKAQIQLIQDTKAANSPKAMY